MTAKLLDWFFFFCQKQTIYHNIWKKLVFFPLNLLVFGGAHLYYLWWIMSHNHKDVTRGRHLPHRHHPSPPLSLSHPRLLVSCPHIHPSQASSPPPPPTSPHARPHLLLTPFSNHVQVQPPPPEMTATIITTTTGSHSSLKATTTEAVGVGKGGPKIVGFESAKNHFLENLSFWAGEC